MSQFDPEAFLDTTVDAPMETKRTPIPEGDQYIGTIKDLKLRTAKDRVIADITWSVLNVPEEVKARLGFQTDPTSRQSIFLDFDGNGRLATGPNMNVQLGRLREALGQNQPGMAWKMLMLKGAGPAQLKVSNRPDPRDASIIYDEVASVTRLAG